MKRPLLTVSLTALIVCAAGTGIYREVNHKLLQVLTRLQETLPANQHFTYHSASPALFIGGATLYDVSFHTPKITFHAKKIRLGRPHFLHDGSISLASLLLEQPDYKGSTFNLSATKAVFRHLLIPSNKNSSTNLDSTTASTHSLAAIMAFNPQNLSTLRFARTHVEQLDFSFPPHHSFLNPALNLSHIHANTFTLEGYGIGTGISTDIQHVTLNLNLTLKSVSSWPLPITNLLFPKKQDSSIPLTVTLNEASARHGRIHWLQHPFHDDFLISEEFQKDPLQSFWANPGSLNMSGVGLVVGSNDTGGQINLDHIIANRRNETTFLRTEAAFEGFHIRPSERRRFSIPINGKRSILRLTETSRQEDAAWRNESFYHLTIPKIGTMSFNAHTHTPAQNPFQQSSSPKATPFMERIIMDDTFLSLHGEHFVDLWLHVFNPTASTTEWTQQHDELLHKFGLLITTRPLLAPMMDYILVPKDRILEVKFGTLSLKDISKLPFSGSINQLLDTAHVTNVTVH